MGLFLRSVIFDHILLEGKVSGYLLRVITADMRRWVEREDDTLRDSHWAQEIKVYMLTSKDDNGGNWRSRFVVVSITCP